MSLSNELERQDGTIRKLI